jgi:hypothetical protein
MISREEALELVELAGEVPRDAAQGIVRTLHDLQKRAHDVLGETKQSEGLQGQFVAVTSEAEQAVAGLEHLHREITRTARSSSPGDG